MEVFLKIAAKYQLMSLEIVSEVSTKLAVKHEIKLEFFSAIF